MERKQTSQLNCDKWLAWFFHSPKFLFCISITRRMGNEQELFNTALIMLSDYVTVAQKSILVSNLESDTTVDYLTVTEISKIWTNKRWEIWNQFWSTFLELTVLSLCKHILITNYPFLANALYVIQRYTVSIRFISLSWKKGFLC